MQDTRLVLGEEALGVVLLAGGRVLVILMEKVVGIGISGVVVWGSSGVGVGFIGLLQPCSVAVDVAMGRFADRVKVRRLPSCTWPSSI